MSSSEDFSPAHRRLMLATARMSIAYGLEHRRPLPVVPDKAPPALQILRATFVTLEKDGNLRGCIGSLEADRPLIVDIAENAFAAAFRDPRFLSVTEEELDVLRIHISVLTRPTELMFQSQEDLLNQLHPGRDGLIIEAGACRGTFLPSVWSSLPEPAEFLRHLKRKAGLPADYWSPDLKIYRYFATVIAE